MLLQHDILLRYKRPEMYILSPNLLLTLFGLRKTDDKLSNNLVVERIFHVLSSAPFVYSPLGLVSKGNSEFQKIHKLSFLPGSSVNNRILQKAIHLFYTTLDNVFQKVVAAKRHFVIIKRNMKNTFSNNFVVPNV